MTDAPIFLACESFGTPLPVLTSPPRRILVVEGDADIRCLNTEVLIAHGYHVDAAEDGAVAWQALRTGSYNLLITDHDLPKVTGIELLKALHGARMAMPVIMAAGNLPKWEFTRHPWIKPAATLLKPYSITELLGTVKAVLLATGSSSGQIALPLTWQSRPSADRLRP